MSIQIPYLITYISYNCVHNTRGIISEDLLDQFILDDVSEYIINNSFSTKFETVDDIVKFWERYGSYNVWEAYCVKNNDWINIKPSNELILENICEITKTVEILEYEEYEKCENIQENYKETCKKNIEEKKCEFDEIFSDVSGENIDHDTNTNINIDWSTIYIQEIYIQEQEEE